MSKSIGLFKFDYFGMLDFGMIETGSCPTFETLWGCGLKFGMSQTSYLFLLQRKANQSLSCFSSILEK
jgi:hypothetical protein